MMLFVYLNLDAPVVNGRRLEIPEGLWESYAWNVSSRSRFVGPLARTRYVGGEHS